MRKQNKGPIAHISKRSSLPWYGGLAIRGAAILLALIACAVVTTALTGEDPIGVYATMFTGAFGTKRKAWILGQQFCCASPWRSPPLSRCASGTWAARARS